MVGKHRGKTMLIQTLIIGVILVLLNVIAQRIYTYIDLTEDKRFTITNSTKSLLSQVDTPVLIDVLLDGELPSGYKRLQNRTEEVIKQLRAINSNIQYTFRNPSEGTPDEKKQIRENLATDGIFPANLIVMEDDKRVEKLIYPYAIIKYGSRQVPVNLLEPQLKGENPEVMLNKSANNLEYKFAKTIQKLYQKGIPKVLLTSGNGELAPSQTATFEQAISGTIETKRVDLDTTYYIPSDIDVVMVARPRTALSDKSKFIIDQYLMDGGKVIWIVESLDVKLDSINMHNVYIPRPIEHGLDDLFFKYGIRVNRDLILDLENSKIPQVIGRVGNKVQQELFDWVYYPVLQSSEQHPIVNNLDRVFSCFPSSIEILEDRQGLSYTPLITSSKYSRFQNYPMRLSFEILKVEQRPEAYNKQHLPVAVMVEGEFESFYKNRVSESMQEGLKKIGREFKDKSPRTTQVFISDSDLIKNLYDPATNRISALGYNKWEDFVYGGNGEFIINQIDYLTDEYGLMESRTKNLKLRMLDQVKLGQDKLKWQLLNIILPILLVIIFGFIWRQIRKRKYS